LLRQLSPRPRPQLDPRRARVARKARRRTGLRARASRLPASTVARARGTGIGFAPARRTRPDPGDGSARTSVPSVGCELRKPKRGGTLLTSLLARAEPHHDRVAVGRDEVEPAIAVHITERNRVAIAHAVDLRREGPIASAQEDAHRAASTGWRRERARFAGSTPDRQAYFFSSALAFSSAFLVSTPAFSTRLPDFSISFAQASPRDAHEISCLEPAAR
jgi:hypothetical protein